MPTYPITLDAPIPRPVTDSDGVLPLCCALETIADEQRPPADTLFGMPWFSPILGSGCLDLGEGPQLDLSDLRERSAELIADAMRAGPDAAADAASYTDLAGFVEGFVEDLYETRILGRRRDEHGRRDAARREPQGGGNDSDLTPPPDTAVQLIAAAALLTRSYHLASASACRPTGDRFVAEVVRVSSGDADPHDEAGDAGGAGGQQNALSLSAVVRGLFAALKDADPVEGLSVHWTDFLGYIERRLKLDRISGLDVQLVTELSWLGLIANTAVYPGWSDLLVRLLAAVPDDEGQRGIRRRLERLDDWIAKEVRALLEPATVASWKSLPRADEDSPPDDTPATASNERDRFYTVIARLLSQQARIRELFDPTQADLGGVHDDDAREKTMAANEAATELKRALTNEALARVGTGPSDIGPVFKWPIPRPVALVTSFDIELEMAFWNVGQRFVEVLPVLVKSKSTKKMPGHLLWLAATFDPGRDSIAEDHPLWCEEPHDRRLAALRGAERTWLPAMSVQPGGKSLGDWSNVPTIVRLCGSPLIDINIEDEAAIKSLVGMSSRERVELIPALTIDEYSSLRLSAHEIYSAALKKDGLPSELLKGTDALPRVWVSFGAQMDDPAVRMRVFSQLSIATITEAADEVLTANEQAEGRQDRDVGRPPIRFQRLAPGLAINRRITDADAAVMRWLGFEFAEVGAGALIGDVVHYVDDHLVTIDAALRGEALQGWATDPDPGEADDRELIIWGRAGAATCDLGTVRRPR